MLHPHHVRVSKTVLLERRAGEGQSPRVRARLPRAQRAGPGGPAEERGWESQPPAVQSAVSEPLAAGGAGKDACRPGHCPPCSRGCAISEENLGADVFQMARLLLSPSLHFLASLLVEIVQEEGTEGDQQNSVRCLVQQTSAAESAGSGPARGVGALGAAPGCCRGSCIPARQRGPVGRPW